MAIASCISIDEDACSPASITRLTVTEEARNGQPFVSPDGDRVTFISNRTGAWEVWVMRADGTDQRRLTDSLGYAGWPSWSPDNEHVLYHDRREGHFAFFSVSEDTGKIVSYPVPSERASHNFRPLLRADGGALLFDRTDASEPANHDLYVYDYATSSLRQLTTDSGYDSDARWSPDGHRIVWHSDRGSAQHDTQIFVMNADGTDVRQLTRGPGTHRYPVWSPDGRHIAYTAQPGPARNQRIGRDIWIMDANGSNRARITTHGGFDSDPAWTPDGASLIFTTDRFGGEELARISVKQQPGREASCVPAGSSIQ